MYTISNQELYNKALSFEKKTIEHSLKDLPFEKAISKIYEIYQSKFWSKKNYPILKLISKKTGDIEYKTIFIVDNSVYSFNDNSIKYGKYLSLIDYHIDSISFIDNNLSAEDKKLVLVKSNIKFNLKYYNQAKKSSFSNKYIQDCLKPDLIKSLYENNIDTGSITFANTFFIGVKSLIKPMGEFQFNLLIDAIKNRKEYQFKDFDFRGYRASVSIKLNEKNEMYGYLSCEYQQSSNGYYFLLINDNTFAFYDKD